MMLEVMESADMNAESSKKTADEADQNEDEHEMRSKCAACRQWLRSASFFMYVTYLLSRWGDRMWHFAVGLYLVHLSGGQLLLAAIFGFTCGGLILLLGSFIGDWVDRNRRLKVVRVSLVTQNVSVAACCVMVCVRLIYGESWWRHLLESCVIALAIVAQLASVAYKIAIEKDWLVVIAAGNKSLLANLNAVTRSLDLACKILSPTVAGLIMTYASLLVSGIVIAVWNVVSLIAEYTILSHVYRLTPALASKHSQLTPAKTQNVSDKLDNEALTTGPSQLSVELPMTTAAGDVNESLMTGPAADASEVTPASVTMTESHDVSRVDTDAALTSQRSRKRSWLTGWKTYVRQSVVFAGISLALLYMTVLGFDSITIGYIYSSGVSELVVGVCMGLAGATGILGTVLFTRLRRRLGLERTGLIAFSAQLSCLTLAVASVWTPGSPFDVHFASRPSVVCDVTDSAVTNVTASSTSCADTSSAPPPAAVNVSIILLLVGIISSRIGLWMADLVVTQTMQESVLEAERGVVGGVQSSLNMLMDMLKFALVIALPQVQLFGIHICLSFAFILSGGLLFSFHVWRRHRSRRGTVA